MNKITKIVYMLTIFVRTPGDFELSLLDMPYFFCQTGFCFSKNASNAW